MAAHTENSLTHCVYTLVSQVYLFRLMIMSTLPFFFPLKGVKDCCSIINDPGSGRHLMLLHNVNTFIVSVRRKQIYFKLMVWEMSTFSCLMFLTVFHINHSISPLISGLTVVSCLVCHVVFHHDTVTPYSSS